MKKFLFLRNVVAAVACLAAATMAVSTARAQSYYAEEYRKSDGKLIAKIWQSKSGDVSKSRRESYATGFGDLDRLSDGAVTVTIIIGNRDSLKSYNLDPKTKTYDVWNLDPQNRNIAVNNGGTQTDNSKRTKELVGTEEVEGYECKHYKYYTDGKNYHDDWIYEPLNLAIQREDGGVKFVLRNIKQGQQPDTLFEIPKDYKANAPADAGALNAVEAILKAQQQQSGEKKQSNGKSDAEKLQEALKMLGGSQKKQQ